VVTVKYIDPKTNRALFEEFDGKEVYTGYSGISVDGLKLVTPREVIEETFAPLEGTDAGVKLDQGKTEMSLLMQGCANAIQKVAEILTFGAKKYTRNGWQTVDDAERRYTDALYRHMNAIHRGEKIDPESGLSHRAHVACNAMFLLELDND
jgi:hypothetical protein